MNIENIDDFIYDNKSLVYYTINKYCPENYRDDDMIQIGYIAMYAAIKSFEEGKGASLHHYIIVCIKKAVYNELKHRNRKKYKDTYYLEDFINTKSNSFDDTSNWENYIEDNSYKEDLNLNIDEATFIAKTKLSDRELSFYEYRKLGYEDIEIAKIWGTSRQRVGQIKNKLRKKWNKYFAENSMA